MGPQHPKTFRSLCLRDCHVHVDVGVSLACPLPSAADRTSLCHDWTMCPSPSVWNKLVWRRAVDFCDGAPAVFSDGISPNDIEQVGLRAGVLGITEGWAGLFALCAVRAYMEDTEPRP